MSTLTAGIVVPALNHVLSNEPWAISRLLPYAGKSLKIVAPPIELQVQISATGMFSAADSRSAAPAVTVTFPNNSVLKLISGDHASALSSVRLSGSADFAETIAFVFRNRAPLARREIKVMRKPISLRSLVTYRRTEPSERFKNLLGGKHKAL